MQYPLANTDLERSRLALQGTTFAAITRRLLCAGNVAAGMRVIDYGSGAGDVSLLAAELVGPEGHVVGIDRDASQVEFARKRATEAGIGNVDFLQGDFFTVLDAPPFDAAVGRFVLTYQPDPVAAVRSAMANVRPGGTCAFLEANKCPESTHLVRWPPLPPAYAHILRESTRALAGAMQHPLIGVQLPNIFREAGLDISDWGFEAVAPLMRSDSLRPAIALAARTTGRLAVEQRLLESGDLDIDAIAQYLDALPEEAAGIGSMCVAGWARKPG